MYYVIGASVSSLFRESVDSLIEKETIKIEPVHMYMFSGNNVLHL